MKNIQFFLIIAAVMLFNGCKQDVPTESPQLPDPSPTTIALFEVNGAKFHGKTGYVVCQMGDTVNYKIIAVDKNKLEAYVHTWSNALYPEPSIKIRYPSPLPDTMSISSSFFIDSNSNPGTSGYQPGTIVKNYITFQDSLNFQTQLEIQCIVSE